MKPAPAKKPHPLLQLLLDFVIFRVVDFVAFRILVLLYGLCIWVLSHSTRGWMQELIVFGFGSIIGGAGRVPWEVPQRVWFVVHEVLIGPCAWAIYLWTCKLITGRTFAQSLLKFDGAAPETRWARVTQWLTLGASAPTVPPPVRTPRRHAMLALGVVLFQLWFLHTLFLA